MGQSVPYLQGHVALPLCLHASLTALLSADWHISLSEHPSSHPQYPATSGGGGGLVGEGGGREPGAEEEDRRGPEKGWRSGGEEDGKRRVRVGWKGGSKS